MESRQFTAAANHQSSFETTGGGFDSDARLSALLAENTRIGRENRIYPTRKEFLEAQSMKNPLGVEKTFAFFGLILGIFPPAAIFYKLFHRGTDEVFLLVLLFAMNVLCAVAGYFAGRLIGRTAFETEYKSWDRMLLTAPLIGALWGLMAGAAGGVLFFVIGAVFGAIVAAMVGAVALSAFTVFHRLLKRGEFIERNHFLPVAVGISLAISAFVLGL